MVYSLGKIESAIQAVVDRLESYIAPGKKLESLNNIYIGRQVFYDGGEQAYDSIYMNITSMDGVSVTQAYSGGENTITVNLEMRYLAPKLKESDVPSYSKNMYFDQSGSGSLVTYQNLLFALVYDIDGNVKPIFNQTLDKFPQAFTSIEEQADFYEYIINFPLDIRYVYDEICGSDS